MNVTLSVESDLLRDAKILAAKKGTSVSRLLGEQLEELVRRDLAYDFAEQRALARMDNAHDIGWQKPPSRSELHDR